MAEEGMAVSVIYDTAAHTMTLHMQTDDDDSATTVTMPFEEFARLAAAMTASVAAVRQRQERRGRERRN